jgi:hypothetical protein
MAGALTLAEIASRLGGRVAGDAATGPSWSRRAPPR